MALKHALLFSGLVSAWGCAQIDGKTDELIESAGGAGDNGSGGKGGGKDAASGDTQGATDGSGSAGDADVEGSPDADVAAPADAAVPPGAAGPDAGDPDVMTKPDAAVPVKVADGTCAAPFELTFSSNRATAARNTQGAAETLSPKCLPSGSGVAPVAGPDHVYRFRMPFKGRAGVSMSASAPFAASAYFLSACGNAATEKACNYAGNLSHDANQGDELFLYVDSGARSGTTPNAGAYTFAVTLREESGADEACGNGVTDPYCSQGFFCQEEGVGGVCRAGTPESCANAVALTFRQKGTSREARVLGSTVGAKDDVAPICPTADDAATLGVDHVYSFTLASTSTIDISLTPATGYDAVLAVLQTSCTRTAAAIACSDGVAQGGQEGASGSLAKGTYYLVVDAASPTSAPSGGYDLTVTVTP